MELIYYSQIDSVSLSPFGQNPQYVQKDSSVSWIFSVISKSKAKIDYVAIIRLLV